MLSFVFLLLYSARIIDPDMYFTSLAIDGGELKILSFVSLLLQALFQYCILACGLPELRLFVNHHGYLSGLT